MRSSITNYRGASGVMLCVETALLRQASRGKERTPPWREDPLPLDDGNRPGLADFCRLCPTFPGGNKGRAPPPMRAPEDLH